MGLPKCGRVQIESYKKSQNFVVKVKKNKYDDTWT